MKQQKQKKMREQYGYISQIHYLVKSVKCEKKCYNKGDAKFANAKFLIFISVERRKTLGIAKDIRILGIFIQYV